MTAYLNDDENVKAMRETARRIGLTQRLLDLNATLSQYVESQREDFAPLEQALRLLGAWDAGMSDEVKS